MCCVLCGGDVSPEGQEMIKALLAQLRNFDIAVIWDDQKQTLALRPGPRAPKPIPDEILRSVKSFKKDLMEIYGPKEGEGGPHEDRLPERKICANCRRFMSGEWSPGPSALSLVCHCKRS